MNVIRELLKQGCQITAYDPAAMERAKAVLGDSIRYTKDPYSAMVKADALLILTEWTEFASLDLRRVRELLRYPVVLDGRNLYSPKEMRQAGLTYHSIGRPAADSEIQVASAANAAKIG